VSLRIVLSHVYSWPEYRRGGERYLHELGSALVDAGHRVDIVTTSGRSPGRGRVLDVDVRYLRRRRLLTRRFGDLAEEAAFGLQALAMTGHRRLDVWHALGTADAAAAVVASRLRVGRTVYTSLGLPERAWRDSRPDRRLHDMVVRGVDHYVCLSAVAGDHLRRDYARQPAVVGGGVDLRRFVPATRRAERPTLLFASALDEGRKNLSLLLEAFALLRDRLPTATLWLSGSGDPRPALARAPQRAAEATTVQPLGRPDDVVTLYAAAWATVLPAHNEAFGLVLLESLACGTPVVALDHGGPAELVSEGIGFTSAADAPALADACEQALELAVAPDIAERCRAAAAEHDWRQSIVPQLESLYGDAS
jgi:glycosyltransferase involved in cell wall biosynthesis